MLAVAHYSNNRQIKMHWHKIKQLQKKRDVKKK